MPQSPHGRHRDGIVRRSLSAARRPAVATTLAITALAASAAGWSSAGGDFQSGLMNASDTTDAKASTHAIDTFAGTPLNIEQQRAERRTAYRKGVAEHAAHVRKQQARKEARERARREAARKKAAAEAAAARRAEEARQAAEARKAAEARAAAEARREAEARKAAEARRAQEEQASRSEVRTAPVTSGDPRAIAQGMLPAYGWDAGQFGCLNALWNKESGWNVGAMNASSGAYGIPQALPGSKMASAGSDWQTNPATQIRWGLGYIQASYGSPCGAWAHSQATGWY